MSQVEFMWLIFAIAFFLFWVHTEWQATDEIHSLERHNDDLQADLADAELDLGRERLAHRVTARTARMWQDRCDRLFFKNEELLDKLAAARLRIEDLEADRGNVVTLPSARRVPTVVNNRHQ